MDGGVRTLLPRASEHLPPPSFCRRPHGIDSFRQPCQPLGACRKAFLLTSQVCVQKNLFRISVVLRPKKSASALRSSSSSRFFRFLKEALSGSAPFIFVPLFCDWLHYHAAISICMDRWPHQILRHKVSSCKPPTAKTPGVFILRSEEELTLSMEPVYLPTWMVDLYGIWIWEDFSMIFMQNPFETLGGAADVDPEDFLTACSSLSATQLGAHPLQLGGSSQDGS